MISTPWLPRTAPIKVIRLRTNRIQCSRSMSRRSLPAGPCASEQPSIEEQRLGDKQHQGKQPHCHHRVHPQICHRQKAVPQIEPDDHVKAGESGQHRRDARLPAKTPLDGLEEDDPLSWGIAIPSSRRPYRRSTGRRRGRGGRGRALHHPPGWIASIETQRTASLPAPPSSCVDSGVRSSPIDRFLRPGDPVRCR